MFQEAEEDETFDDWDPLLWDDADWEDEDWDDEEDAPDEMPLRRLDRK